MTAIRKRIRLLAFAAGLGAILLICLFIVIINESYFMEYKVFILYFFMPVTLAAAIILFRKYKKLITAEVIIENQIVYIHSGCFLFEDLTEGGKKNFPILKKSDVFISNFGMLLGSKIIQFIPERIVLKAVEIGRDYILITYATKDQAQTVRFFHQEIDSDELKKIAEKFSFETGVIPEITE